jgi:hypothetical protein
VLPALLLGATLVPAATTDVGGIVFRDYNDDGNQDAREPGVPNILVRVFPPTGAPFEALTQANGSYTVATTLAAGTRVRVEFDVPQGGFQSGAFGVQSSTTVQFVTAPATAVNLGINRPAQYCQRPEDLTFVTSCYVGGDQLITPGGGARQDPVLVDVPYLSGRTPPFSGPKDPGPSDHQLMVPSRAVGSVWGLAYQRSTNTYFAGSFLKRHSGFGPNGPGAIYRFDPSVMSGNAALFLDLNALFPLELPAGTDPRPAGFPSEQYIVDGTAFGQVGKVGFGDLDMFEDDQTLYAIALGNRRLYEIPVGDGPAAPPASAIRSFALPDPGQTGPDACPLDLATPAGQPNLNLRPFGLAIHDGLVYVGVVCTAENLPAPNNSFAARQAELRAYVYSFQPAAGGGAFAATPVLSFALNYERGCLESNLCLGPPNTWDTQGMWRPWSSDFDAEVDEFDYFANNSKVRAYPEPWLTSITFDHDAMVIGLRDRYGDKMGAFAGDLTNPPLTPLPGNQQTPYYLGLAGGDVLRACRQSASVWVIEGSPGCPVNTPGLPNNRAQGPVVPQEFYYQDDHPLHDEVGGGAVLQVAGFPELVASHNDPIRDGGEIFQGGYRWLHQPPETGQGVGTTSWSYVLYQGSILPPPINDPNRPPEFAKSNGLGDIEPACRPMPVEIGNRVWYDTNQDGVQDPDELPAVGVTLLLYDEQGQVVARAVTNARGEYIFRGGPVSGDANPNDEFGELAGPVRFNARYRIQIEPAGNWDAPGAPLRDWYLTGTERGDSRVRDSNGRWRSTGAGPVEGIVFADVFTGRAGFNDHTFDFGFIQQPTSLTLTRFTATPAAAAVEVRWTTSAEHETWGFHLYRSTSRDRATAVRITANLIPARGGDAEYFFQDGTAVANTTYYYWLEEIELNGTVSEHGPASTAQLSALNRHLYLPLVRSGGNR